MNTEELKLIVEMFSTVTDGALVGGVTYIVLQFLGKIVPWIGMGWIVKTIASHVKIIHKEGKK